MDARGPVGAATYEGYSRWDAQIVKMLLRASSEVLNLLRESMNENIITAYLSLMAAHNNWDGFLGSAVYLQKQQYPVKDIQDCLNIAIMIAYHKIGSLDKAMKAAAKFDPRFSQWYFSFLDSRTIWKGLDQISKTERTAAVTASLVKSSAPKKKKKGKSKKVRAPTPPDASHISQSSSTSSTSVESVPKAADNVPTSTEDQVEYEPDSKPEKAPVGLQPAAVSSSASSCSESLLDTPPDDDDVDPGPGRMVFLECPVCMDRFPDHMIRPCGHTFCLRCIRSMSACAICRQLIKKWYKFFHSQSEPNIGD
jgi:hypothetical protein